MNTRSVLVGQIGSWVDSLNQAMRCLQLRQLDAEMRRRINIRLETDLTKGLKTLTSLQQQVQNGAELSLSWVKFQTDRRESARVLHECLAFIEGALVRANNIDGGVCRIADAMLCELNHLTDVGWSRFTILADGEFFAGLSGIIRLRFADVSIWNLPVCAHEFGHFVGKKDPNLDEIISREKRKEPRYDPFLQEHFADLFATYTVGPAFALNCVLLRFSPSGAFQEGSTHPSDAHRVWWMLQTLRRMEKRQSPGPRLYDHMVTKIQELWTSSLIAAGDNKELPARETARLGEWLDELFDAIDTSFPRARFGGWMRAEEMAEQLRKKRPPTLHKEDDIPGILNAAWLCRSESDYGDGYEVSWLADQALRLCQEVTERPGTRG